jgi:predicted transcriptional regulator of viral defense system
MKEYTQVRYWVDDLPRMGRSTFSLEDAVAQFPEKPIAYIKNALGRLAASGKVQSVWKGFYAVMLPEYGLKGNVPPTEYIDHLMKYLGKDYYIALLSAASLEGAAHQKPQVFNFISNQILHPKTKYGIRLEPAFKQHIPHNYIIQKNVRSGTVNISVPELTAVDLLSYPKKSGGINSIATVLSELAENMNFSNVGTDFFSGVPVPIVQRLGYLLDDVLDEKTLSAELLEKAISAGLYFRKTPLVASQNGDTERGNLINKKWKVIVNYDVEADDL